MRRPPGQFARWWVRALVAFLRACVRGLDLKDGRRVKARKVSVELQVVVAAAFARRAWPDFAKAVDALGRVDPPAAAYWRLRQDDLLQANVRSGAAWDALYESLHGRGHRLAATALEGILRSALLEDATVDRVQEILDLFERRYGIPCPQSLLPATGTWLLGRGRPREALLLAEKSIAAQPDPQSKATTSLRTCSLRLACAAGDGLSPEALPVDGNPFTSALWAEMRQVPSGSVAAAVFAAAEACWNGINRQPAYHAHDLRFSDAQRQTLVTRIADALRQRCPLALVHLGDADSYGFAPSMLPSDEHGDREQEEIWWGKALTELQR